MNSKNSTTRNSGTQGLTAARSPFGFVAINSDENSLDVVNRHLEAQQCDRSAEELSAAGVEMSALAQRCEQAEFDLNAVCKLVFGGFPVANLNSALVSEVPTEDINTGVYHTSEMVYELEPALSIVDGRLREQGIENVTAETLLHRGVSVRALATRCTDKRSFDAALVAKMAIGGYSVERLNSTLESALCPEDVETGLFWTEEARRQAA